MVVFLRCVCFLVFFFASSSSSYCYCDATDASFDDDDERFSYGTEVSWPMQHHYTVDHRHDEDAAMVVVDAVTSTSTDDLEPHGRQQRRRRIVDEHQSQQHKRYQEFMAGCTALYGHDRCYQSEQERVQLNARQPAYQYQNFTTTGYAVVTVPTVAWDALERFWWMKGGRRGGKVGTTPMDDNNNNDDDDELWWQRRDRREDWEYGSVYTNHWVAPTYHVSIDEEVELCQTLVENIQSVLERWSGTPLIHSSTYGIRVYTRGSILTPHVDRVPLVISAIVNVAQDNNKKKKKVKNDNSDDNDDDIDDWVLEVIGHDGVAVNLTVAPGEMILYESHSIIHGRPYPLTGRYYANLFFHFEPVGYTQELMKRISSSATTTTTTARQRKSNKELFQAALAKSSARAGNSNGLNNNDDASSSNSNPTKEQRYIGSGGGDNHHHKSQQQPEPQHPPQRSNNDKDDHPKKNKSFDLPYYIVEGTKEAARWRQEFVFRRKVLPPKPPVLPFHQRLVTVTTGDNSNPHTVAARGDLAVLIALSVSDVTKMDLADRNGWKPIHEAARAGRAEIVKYLVETHHVDVNERTNEGLGGSPLWWAEQSGNVETINLLKSYGAKSYEPELD